MKIAKYILIMEKARIWNMVSESVIPISTNKIFEQGGWL